MANEVNIKITADDKASPKIKELGSRAERTADKLRSMRGPLLAITGALTAVGTVGVKNASDLGESINAVEVVFKDASKTITDFSEIAATQAGLSMEAFNSQAVLTGSLLQNFGLSADESAEQTVRLAKRASDLASVFNTDVEQAMGAINAALRGETEQIRRFAVSIDDATLKNKAMAMGLADSEGEITRSAKSLAALELVMEQSADVQGDFINTSDSLANSTRIMKADFTNVSEVETALSALAKDDYVAKLEREPGKRESRYMHLFADPAVAPSPVPATEVAEVKNDEINELLAEIEELKAELSRIKAHLGL